MKIAAFVFKTGPAILYVGNTAPELICIFAGYDA